MDWDNVRVFLAVARAGQFVAAAKRLRLDHATVSRRIAALEAGLGARLFDRRTTGAKLTAAGETFLATAEQMESAFLHAQGEMSGVDLELVGDVRIGAPDGFSTYYLTGTLRDFAERHPGVRLQLMPLPQLTPLARREIDVVVGLDKPEAGRFVARKLTDYTLGIYASAGYVKRHGAPEMSRSTPFRPRSTMFANSSTARRPPSSARARSPRSRPCAGRRPLRRAQFHRPPLQGPRAGHARAAREPRLLARYA
jgi:DNA-binding transcriptional LysR family regulator